MKRKAAMTRREFSTILAGAAAGLAVPAAAQTPAEPAKPPVDGRIAWLISERGASGTEAQNSGIADQLKQIDGTAAAMRKYHLDDGGSEPATVFFAERSHA